jgi:hypothetical protein
LRRRRRGRVRERAPPQKKIEKNTIDLQWEMRANYNARLWAGSRNPPEQKQWPTMEKTMRRAIGTVGKFGQC